MCPLAGYGYSPRRTAKAPHLIYPESGEEKISIFADDHQTHWPHVSLLPSFHELRTSCKRPTMKPSGEARTFFGIMYMTHADEKRRELDLTGPSADEIAVGYRGQYQTTIF